MKQLSTLLIAVFLFTAITPTKAQVNTQDSLALVDLYDSTGGPNWTINTNWLTKAPVSTWWGIGVDSDNRVDSIELSYTGLVGTIPSSIVNLTQIRYLTLDGNSLTGIIPTSIGNLTNLQVFSLEYNQLSGSIPTSIGKLTNLLHLTFAANQLTGSIPTSIGNLTNLRNMYLYGNQLSDSIPSSIGNMTNITDLELNNNNLSGSVPASMNNLTNLVYLFLHENQLSGTIPSIGNLTKLTDGVIASNKFTFAGMEAIAKNSAFQIGNRYAPQATVPLLQNNTDTTLSVSVGGTPANDTYKWYNSGKLIATIKSDSTYRPTSNGQYYVVATNAVATQLTLYSDTITITNLPIKSINLQAKETNGQVLLQWQTIDELNTASFIIQHSTDGATFSDIATKEAVCSGNNGYSFIDKLPAEGINYYRIKAVDKDGASSFSKVVSVQLTVNRLPFTVVPNPVRDVAMIRGSHIASVQVIDNKGNLVKVISLHDATNPTLSVSNLATGVYYLHIKTSDGEEKVISFVKQ